jgi:hypothetical protein
MRCCGFWRVYHAPNVSSQSHVLLESLACVSLTEFVVAFCFMGSISICNFSLPKQALTREGANESKKTILQSLEQPIQLAS